MRHGLARILLILAFLAAQTAGIAHQAWHDAGPLAAHSDAGGDGKAKKNPLCDFHTALASVLGALASASQNVELENLGQAVFAATDASAARFSLLASRSRGPPALL
jgi:hypothetical protein